MESFFFIYMAPWQRDKGNVSTYMLNFSVGAWKGWQLGRQMLIYLLFLHEPFLEVEFVCVPSISAEQAAAPVTYLKLGSEGMPPGNRSGGCRYGWEAGLMCSALSLMGIYISLSGRRSGSAITQPCYTATASRATCEGMQPRIVSDPAPDSSPPHKSCFWQLWSFFKKKDFFSYCFSTEAVRDVTNWLCTKPGAQITPSPSGVATTLTKCGRQKK